MSQELLDLEVLEEQRAAFMQALVGAFQARLYELNEKDGTKQRDIAVRLGHRDPTYISRCLSGQRNMTLATAHDLARALNSRLEISLKPYEKMVPTNKRPTRPDAPLQTASPKSGAKKTNYFGANPATAAATWP